jgi:four helix bundle protein
MTYEQWETEVPAQMKEDTAWRIKAYKLSLFLSDLVWIDAPVWLKDRRSVEIVDQLCRASGRISASIIEGYSRDTGKARATFYEYALGSARESRDWYYKGRRLLKPAVYMHRVDLCTQISKLTLTMISNERQNNRRVSKKA